MDYGLVQELRGSVAEQLRAERRRRAEARQPLASEDERQLGWSLILSTIERLRNRELVSQTGTLPAPEEDQVLAEAVHAAMFGLGRLQPLIADERLSNIEINGCDNVLLYHTDGTVTAGDPVADSDDELIEWVRNTAAFTGLSSRPFDWTNPHLVCRLPDGSRLAATQAVTPRPVISIRLYRLTRVHLADLQAAGSFSPAVAAFLRAAVAARMNIMVSGETFAGKTTMVRALTNEIPPEERIFTAEHFRELGLDHFRDLHRDPVAAEERPPGPDGGGAVTLRDLVNWARRHNPDRLIVGEVVGDEILDMLDAMINGEDGSLSTIHARSSAAALRKIGIYALRAPERMPFEASAALISDAVQFIVHMSLQRTPDGRLHRQISSIREIVDLRQDGGVASSEVLAADQGPPHVSDARAGQLAAAGYDQRAWAAAGPPAWHGNGRVGVWP